VNRSGDVSQSDADVSPSLNTHVVFNIFIITISYSTCSGSSSSSKYIHSLPDIKHIIINAVFLDK
jgi:hypothetical protein